jgi:tight adherence protein C
LRDALRRVGEVGSGVLTGELRAAVLASGTGSSLPDALLSVSKSLDVPALARAIEHRGGDGPWSALAHVLQEQAVDAREDAKRGLLELAGRKEILMLLPLVFLILPLSVLFAIFPGIVMLRLGVG